jgi:hypothetical protein
MVDQQILQVLLDRIGALEDSLGQRFDGVDARLDRVNGRLDRHDTAIGAIQSTGCARFTAHLNTDPTHAPSRARQVAQTGTIAGVAIALFEMLKAGFGAIAGAFK